MKIPVTVYENINVKLSMEEVYDLAFWRGVEVVNIGGQEYIKYVIGGADE